MGRYLFAGIVVMLAASASILYYQWLKLPSIEEKDALVSPLIQHITITHEDGYLSVTQSVAGAAKEYIVTIPKGVTNVTCGEKQATCPTKANKMTFKEKDKDKLVFNYRVTLPKQAASLWLKEWFLIFDVKDKVQNFSVEMTDARWTKGTWVAGASLLNRVDQKSFLLYSWEQKDVTSFPLYFEATAFPVQTDDNIAIYGTKDKVTWERELLDQFSNTSSFTAVYSKLNTQYMSETLLIIPKKLSAEMARANYTKFFLKTKFANAEKTPPWIWDLLTSFITNQPTTLKESKIVSAQMSKQLSSEEKKKFIDKLLKLKDVTLSTKDLNKALTSAYGEETTFFTDMVKENNTQLVFRDPTAIYVKDVQLENTKLLTLKHEKYYPFMGVMEPLGFQIVQSGDNIDIKRGYSHWNVDVNKRLKDKVGLPVIINRINGELYITEDMMTEFFDVRVDRGQQEVYLSVDEEEEEKTDTQKDTQTQ